MTIPLQVGRVPSAEYSPCRRYRYLLRWPTGVDNDRACLWILANPSTATEEQVDPTVSRCIRYSRDWGYGWCWVVNVRAWRETDPRKVPPDPEAIGPDNIAWITGASSAADLAIAGYGKLGGAQGQHVLRMLRRLGIVVNALRLNRDGSPAHPLYLPASLKPVPMEDS